MVWFDDIVVTSNDTVEIESLKKYCGTELKLKIQEN